MNIYRSSRRTIMSGEVVTFATAFKECDGVFGPHQDTRGPFEGVRKSGCGDGSSGRVLQRGGQRGSHDGD